MKEMMHWHHFKRYCSSQLLIVTCSLLNVITSLVLGIVTGSLRTAEWQYQ